MVGQERGQVSHSPSEPPQTAVVPEPWSHTPSHLVTGVSCHCVQTKLRWRKQVFCRVAGASPPPAVPCSGSQELAHAASLPGGYATPQPGKSTVEWELHWRPGTEPWQLWPPIPHAGLGFPRQPASPARTWVHTLVLSHMDGRLPLPTELNPWRDKELLPESPGSAEVLLCWIEGTGVKGCGGSW